MESEKSLVFRGCWICLTFNLLYVSVMMPSRPALIDMRLLCLPSRSRQNWAENCMQCRLQGDNMLFPLNAECSPHWILCLENWFWLWKFWFTLSPEWALLRALRIGLWETLVSMDVRQHCGLKDIVFLLIKGSQAEAGWRKCWNQRSELLSILIFSELWAEIHCHMLLPATRESLCFCYF